ncbi:MAG: ribonuclease Z [Nanobdellota archaeon]
MQIIFLGTSAMVPTKERNHFSFYLKYKNEGMLFDCGEGTQRQLRIARIKPSKITKIFITHFHGDHILGLPGLLQTLSASQYDAKLRIYGPHGLNNVIKKIKDLFIFDNRLDIEINEIGEGEFLKTDEFSVECFDLKHGVKCLGYRFTEKDRLRIDLTKAKKFGLKQGPKLGKLQQNIPVKIEGKTISPKDVTYNVRGKKIGFIADTKMTENVNKIAKDVDLLISESTLISKHKQQAEEFNHFTSREAATIAKENNAKKLILTHISQRYKNPQVLLDDAKDIFEDTFVAEDFMKIKI